MFWLFLIVSGISALIYQLGAYSIWKVIIVFFIKSFLFISILLGVGYLFRKFLPVLLSIFKNKQKRMDYKGH